MKEKDIIREIMANKGISQSELARDMGYAAQSGIGNMLNGRNSMRVDTFVRLMERLGCEVRVESEGKSWKVGEK